MGMSFNARMKAKEMEVTSSPKITAGKPSPWLRRMLLFWLCFIALGARTAEQLPTDQPIFVPVAPKKLQEPHLPDEFERRQIRSQAMQAQERFRKRIVLPREATGFIPAEGTAAALKAFHEKREMPEPLFRLPENIGARIIVMLALSLGVFLIAIKKVAPGLARDINRWFNPWVYLRPVAANSSANLLAEDRLISEFRDSFSITPGSETEMAEDEAVGVDVGESTSKTDQPKETPFQSATNYVHEMRKLLQEARQSASETSQRAILRNITAQIKLLKVPANHPELALVRQLASAMEMLLVQLTEKASNVTSSTLRTLALGVDLMENLCKPGLNPKLLTEPGLRLLVVDDEAFSRYALCHSLKRALAEPHVAENGESALVLAAKGTYDLIFLDVNMPGMDGFELCTKIHELPTNRNTPVVFVTSMNDFDTRAKSVLSGGRDIIAKPFLTFELALKALTMVTRERLLGRVRIEEAPAESAPEKIQEAVAPKQAIALPEKAPAVESAPKIPAPPITTAKTVAVSPPKTVAAFFAQAEKQAADLLELAERLNQSPDQDTQHEIITHLYLRSHSFAVNAESFKQHSVFRLASALEGLLKKLREKSSNRSASTLQAVTNSVRLIKDMCVARASADLGIVPPIRVLAVDDNPLSLRAIINGLQLKFIQPEKAADGETALALASDELFDVIFMDVQMPGMDGFEACQKIRESTINRETPVVFVTNSDGPSARTQADICGGTDFISKSFLCSELTLKTLTFALRGRLEKGRQDGGFNPAPASSPKKELEMATS